MRSKRVKTLKEIFSRLRWKREDVGFGCDFCETELFDYPKHRLCRACEEKLPLIGEKRCTKCGRKATVLAVCTLCKQRTPLFTQAFSLYNYDGIIPREINRFKSGDRYLRRTFGERLYKKVHAFTKDREEEFLLVPVPLSETRLKTRGYNQSAELAKVVSMRTGIPVLEDLLEKAREADSQKDAVGESRFDNVKGAYRVKKRKACFGKSILLIDDIMTTGATVSECARVLTNAGAKNVYVFTLASVEDKLKDE